jgi:hypothetical protein
LEAFFLYLSSLDDLVPQLRRGDLRRPPVGKVLVRDPCNLDVQVDSVDERPAQAAQVSLYVRLLARATLVPISEKSARARVHGTHKQHACWKLGRDPGTRHGEGAFFKGLAKLLECLAPEFRQLVQKEHPIVSQADLAGTRQGPSPDEPGVRDVVMGRPERPASNQRGFQRQ